MIRRLVCIICIMSGLAARCAVAGEGGALHRAQVIELSGVQGRIDHLAVDVEAKRLYVAALGNNSLEVLDLTAGKRVQSVADLGEPQGVGVVPSSGNVVVASGKDGKCRVLDRSLKVLATIDHLDDADNVRIDAAANRAYVGYGSGALAAIDLAHNKLVGTIKLDAHPESFQLEPNGTRIFVNVPSAKQIAVIDREKQAVVATWPVKEASANFPMALDEANHRLLVVCRRPAKLLVIDTEAGQTVASIDCGADADDVFYDPSNKRAYISGGDATISIVTQRGANDYALAETIKTAPGARTALFAPALGKYFLAVPHRGAQAAEVWVYDVVNANGG